MTDLAHVPAQRVSRAAVAMAAAAGILVAAAVALWVHYGGTVFYEMIAAGLALCF